MGRGEANRQTVIHTEDIQTNKSKQTETERLMTTFRPKNPTKQTKTIKTDNGRLIYGQNPDAIRFFFFVSLWGVEARVGGGKMFDCFFNFSREGTDLYFTINLLLAMVTYCVRSTALVARIFIFPL